MTENPGFNSLQLREPPFLQPLFQVLLDQGRGANQTIPLYKSIADGDCFLDSVRYIHHGKSKHAKPPSIWFHQQRRLVLEKMSESTEIKKDQASMNQFVVKHAISFLMEYIMPFIIRSESQNTENTYISANNIENQLPDEYFRILLFRLLIVMTMQHIGPTMPIQNLNVGEFVSLVSSEDAHVVDTYDGIYSVCGFQDYPNFKDPSTMKLKEQNGEYEDESIERFFLTLQWLKRHASISTPPQIMPTTPTKPITSLQENQYQNAQHVSISPPSVNEEALRKGIRKEERKYLIQPGGVTEDWDPTVFETSTDYQYQFDHVIIKYYSKVIRKHFIILDMVENALKIVKYTEGHNNNNNNNNKSNNWKLTQDNTVVLVRLNVSTGGHENGLHYQPFLDSRNTKVSTIVLNYLNAEHVMNDVILFQDLYNTFNDLIQVTYMETLYDTMIDATSSSTKRKLNNQIATYVFDLLKTMDMEYPSFKKGYRSAIEKTDHDIFALWNETIEHVEKLSEIITNVQRVTENAQQTAFLKNHYFCKYFQTLFFYRTYVYFQLIPDSFMRMRTHWNTFQKTVTDPFPISFFYSDRPFVKKTRNAAQKMEEYKEKIIQYGQAQLPLYFDENRRKRNRRTLSMRESTGNHMLRKTRKIKNYIRDLAQKNISKLMRASDAYAELQPQHRNRINLVGGQKHEHN